MVDSIKSSSIGGVVHACCCVCFFLWFQFCVTSIVLKVLLLGVTAVILTRTPSSEKKSVEEVCSGKKQKEEKRNAQKKQRSQRSRPHKSGRGRPVAQEGQSSEPDTTTDVEVSACKDASVAGNHNEELENTVLVAPCETVEPEDEIIEMNCNVSGDLDVAHAGSDASTEVDCQESPEVDCQEFPSITCSDRSDTHSEAEVLLCESASEDTGCGCEDKCLWGCERCRIYSSALLLVHRAISARAIKGPPGLAIPANPDTADKAADDEEKADCSDWQEWLGEQEPSLSHVDLQESSANHVELQDGQTWSF